MKTGSIHYEGIEQNLEYYIDSGVQGILIAGATGEFGVMRPWTSGKRSQRQALVVALTVVFLPLSAPPQPVQQTTIEVTQHAAEHGAAGVMVLAPARCRTG